MASVEVASRTEEALARSAVYRLLSQALAYPTADSVRELQQEDLSLVERHLDLLTPDVRIAARAAVEALRGLEIGELEATHRDVFSHVHSPDCSAFENDYAEGDVWRRAHQLADLSGFYRAFGVGHPSERPDHIAVELEFLYLLSYKLAWALASGDEEHAEVCAGAEDRFLEDHVLRWMPGFAERLSRVGAGGPYAAVAHLLSTLLDAEAARTGIRPDAATTLPETQPEVTGACE